MIDEMKRQKRELVYKGSILDIYKDTMQFANGKTEEWDFVSHRKGAAAVLPVLDDGRIIMVRQYRNALEMPICLFFIKCCSFHTENHI